MPNAKALALVQPASGDNATSGGGDKIDEPREMWLRRQALNLVPLLPDDNTDALKVLELAIQVVKQWWQSNPA